MSCTIIFNNFQKTVTSDEELDNYIITNQAYLEKLIKNNGENITLEDIFDISPGENTKTILNNFFKETRDWQNTVKRQTLSPSSAPALLFNDKDSSKPAFPFNDDAYEAACREKWNRQTHVPGDMEFNFKAIQALNKDKGTWVHKIFEQAINGTSINSINKSHLKPSDGGLNYAITPKAVSEVAQAAQDFLSWINDKSSSNLGMSDWAKFTECPIGMKAEDFTEDFKALLNAADSEKTYKGIYGLSDLITVNKANGHIVIFDYKTVGDINNVSQEVKDKAAIQLTLYSELLKNQGLTVDAMYVIPIQVDIETEQGLAKVVSGSTGNMFSITGCKFDKSKIYKVEKSNRFVSRVHSFFSHNAVANNDDITKVKDLFKRAFYNLSDSSINTYDDETIRRFVDNAKTKNASYIRVYSVDDLSDKQKEKYKDKIKDNAYFVYRNEKIMGHGDPLIFFKSNNDTEINEFLAKHFKKIFEDRALLFKNAGETLKSIISESELTKYSSFDQFAKDLNHSNPNYIKNIFKKYINDNWEMQSNEALCAEGIYIFCKNGRAEIVNLSNQDLFRKIKLKNGSQTVLQNMIYDTEVGTDNTKTLNTLYGNFLTLKSMMLLAQVKDLLTPGTKVQAIKVLNPWRCQLTDQPIGLCEETWTKFCHYWNGSRPYSNDKGEPITKEKINLVTSKENDLLMDPILAYIYRARDIIMEENYPEYINTEFENVLNKVSSDHGYVEIFKLMKAIKREAYDSHGVDLRIVSESGYNNPWRAAYNMLYRALLSASRWDIQIENDVAQVFDSGIRPDGVYAIDPAFSKSATMRIMSSMMAAYREKVRDVFNAATGEWQMQLAKALEERGIGKEGEGAEKLFKKWFRNDGSMKIINPNSAEFDFAGPEEKKLAKLLLKDFNRFRGFDENDVSEKALEIPLLEVGFFKSIEDWDSAKKAAQRKAAAIKDLVYGLFVKKDRSTTEIKNLKNIDEESVKDYYFSQDSEHRAKELEKNGESLYEHNIDTIYLYAAASHVTEQVSRAFMPYFSGVRSVLMSSGEINGIAEENITKAVEDFIRKAVFEKSIVEVNHQNLYKVINVLKSITSWTTLAFKLDNFTRENLASTLRTSSSLLAMSFNKAVKDNAINDLAYDMNEIFMAKVKASDYIKELENIIATAIGDKEKTLFNAQMNMIYGMTGVSARQLADVKQRFGTNEINFENGFFTTTWPDFIHRNALLHAYLKSIGAYNAYKIDGNVLKYDMEKDERYKNLFKYNFTQDLGKVNESDRKRYIWELSTYKNNLTKWRRTYPELSFGDKLPQALNVDEMSAIRNYADSLYGSYDQDTKALIQSQTLGSLFFQYKNFSMQLLTGWFAEPGHVSNERFVQMTDESGNRMFHMVHTPEEIKNGAPVSELVPESEVTKEMIAENRAEPYMVNEQDPLLGKFTQHVQTIHAIYKGDKEFLDRISKSPVMRYNIFMTLYDSFFMTLLSGLIAMLYGKEKTSHMKDQDWWTRWSYAVLSGMANDGPIMATISSVVGDASMPMVTTIQGYLRNAYSVITGRKNAAYAFLNSFGATRTLTSFFRDMTEE